MRIAQTILDGAPAFERNAQRVDFEALRKEHEVFVADPADLRRIEADVLHVYGPAGLPRRPLRRVKVPYVASGKPLQSRLPFGKPAAPQRILTPFRDGDGTFVPEAVDDAWFGISRSSPSSPTIGSYGRKSVTHMVEQSLARIQRFRDDVTWTIFDTPPAPEQIASLSAWVDPAVDESDYDGFVAQAIAAGVPVVATRTPVNSQRLEKGRCGFLTPPGDPNEMVHAILTALFKPEAAREREAAARQTASKFRVRQRLKVLLPVYESLIQ